MQITSRAKIEMHIYTTLRTSIANTLPIHVLACCESSAAAAGGGLSASFSVLCRGRALDCGGDSEKISFRMPGRNLSTRFQVSCQMLLVSFSSADEDGGTRYPSLFMK